MTRFEMEISGMLDAQTAARRNEPNRHFWENRAKEEAAKAVFKAEKNAVVDCNGAISWKSNGSYLMDDICEKLEYAGYDFDRKATAEAREFQTVKFLEKAKKSVVNTASTTPEEMAELRAAFGGGTTVVNVITGKKFVI